jgi:hypothetical protein
MESERCCTRRTLDDVIWRFVSAERLPASLNARKEVLLIVVVYKSGPPVDFAGLWTEGVENQIRVL